MNTRFWRHFVYGFNQPCIIVAALVSGLLYISAKTVTTLLEAIKVTYEQWDQMMDCAKAERDEEL
jgi:hypothetical protein